MSYRKLTKAEQKIRKAKQYSTFEGGEAWWYVGKGTTEFYLHVADGTVVRMTVGTRYLKNAIRQVDQEVASRAAVKKMSRYLKTFDNNKKGK
jgi:hypothetical protein